MSGLFLFKVDHSEISKTVTRAVSRILLPKLFVFTIMVFGLLLSLFLPKVENSLVSVTDKQKETLTEVGYILLCYL